MYERFTFSTFDSFETHCSRVPWGEGICDGVPFPIDDPFGLRRAILPVFLRYPDGCAVGCGTAFHIDGWGRLLTADHVVEEIRAPYLRQITQNAQIKADVNRDSHVAVLLGYGVVFGTVGIPNECWAPMQQVDAFIVEREDPMAELLSNSTYQIGPDIAGMSAFLHPNAPPLYTVPVIFHASPKVGDRVLAVGYPELDFEALNENGIARYLKEGMFGVYGTVTSLCPGGRGKSRPSPGFEVAANWPAGMSGGPVFTERGEVVGIVSSSLQSSEGEPGVGFATSLAMIPDASKLTPTLDSENPGCRLGFGVLCTSPWHLAGVFKSRGDADSLRKQLPPGYLVKWGSHRLGGDDFIALE
ncbi:trypsin-like peptidase domain-containing protein [Bordetella petrii]|uniref:trypsin-like peptidase domain-containing protein n=1 Tax=Bordetella petrii TaxID=94624 RepID=UPI0037312194